MYKFDNLSQNVRSRKWTQAGLSSVTQQSSEVLNSFDLGGIPVEKIGHMSLGTTTTNLKMILSHIYTTTCSSYDNKSGTSV